MAALIVIVLSVPAMADALPKGPPAGGAVCKPIGISTPQGTIVDCCWMEPVEPGTGGYGQNLEKEMYCSTCTDTGQDIVNCSEPSLQYHEGKPDANPGIPPTGGVSDDPQAGDNPNPGIPPTGGVSDETENDDNSGSDNDNRSDEETSNTIPRKGGDLDASDLSENVIGQ